MAKSIPNTLKGFRDFLPTAKAARDRVERTVTAAFERYGFQPLETPTLEYAALIAGKYGEDADRLIYRFEDRGGRGVALPYDQTVPTARVLAQYQRELPRYFRRYSLKNVFRAERPQKGRYREFRQCDIDIYGSTSPLADAEIVACTWSAFDAIGFREIEIKINDRQVLVATLEPFATDDVDVFSIIRSIDKLDKLPVDKVVAELVDKGLAAEAADGALEAIRSAPASANLTAVLDATAALGVPQGVVQYEPTLARGLDYYTGAIFEVLVPQAGSGSLAGGGRYDDLIEQLGGPAIPAVGIAFGFDRVVEAATELELVPAAADGADVLVTIFDESDVAAPLAAAGLLRAGGVRVEVNVGADKLGKQFKLADQKRIPLAIIVGPDEAARGEVTLRNLRGGDQQVVKTDQLVATVTAALAQLRGSG